MEIISTIPENSYGKTKCKEKLVYSILATKGELTEYSIAECMFLLYKDEFIYYNEWYIISNGTKLKIKNGTELRKRIPILKIVIDEELSRIRVEIKVYEKKLGEIDDVEEKEENTIYIKNKIKQLDTTRAYFLYAKNILDKTGFKNNVMTECKDLFLSTIHEQLQVKSYKNTKSLSPLELFIKYLIMDDIQFYNQEMILLSTYELFIKIENFLYKNNISYDVNVISLGVRLKKLNINGIVTGINAKEHKKVKFIKKDTIEHYETSS